MDKQLFTQMGSVRNSLLHNAIRAFCVDSISHFQRIVRDGKQLVGSVREKYEFTDSGLSHGYVDEVDWPRSIGKQRELLQGLPSYHAAIREFQTSEMVTSHFDKTGLAQGSTLEKEGESCVTAILTEVLQQGGLGFDEERFNAIYQRVEDYFCAKTIEYRCLAPIEGLEFGDGRVDMGENLSIIKISDEEKAEILGQSGPFHSDPMHNLLLFYGYAFEYYASIPKTSQQPSMSTDPGHKAQRIFDEAISAMRLFKTGKIGYSSVRTKSTLWNPHLRTSTLSRNALKSLVGNPYILQVDEVPSFLSFWNQFKVSRRTARNRIEMALRRLNLGYERQLPEDRLIDYLFAFEALLLQSEPQELAYRLALRGSALLGTTPQERQRIFADIKAAYHERSSIAHGGDAKKAIRVGGQSVNFHEFVTRIENLLRLAINKFLICFPDRSEDDIIKTLDESIISGTPPFGMTNTGEGSGAGR